MGQIRQSRPDYGLGFQVKVLQPFQVVPFSLGSKEQYSGRAARGRGGGARARPLATRRELCRGNPEWCLFGKSKGLAFTVHLFTPYEIRRDSLGPYGRVKNIIPIPRYSSLVEAADRNRKQGTGFLRSRHGQSTFASGTSFRVSAART